MGQLLHLDRDPARSATVRRRRTTPAAGVTRLQPRFFQRFAAAAGAETTLRAFAALAARGEADDATATYFVGSGPSGGGSYLYLTATRMPHAAVLQLDAVADGAGACTPDTTLAGVLRAMRSPAVLLGGAPAELLTQLRDPAVRTRAAGRRR